MRDPLGRVPLAYKFALLFGGVSLVAFGGGGLLVHRTSRTALEAEIRGRVAAEAATLSTALAAQLRLYGRRMEDFASDGYIRDRLARAADPAARAELADHLRRNKLPLVGAFLGLAAEDAAEAPAVAVGAAAETGGVPHEAVSRPAGAVYGTWRPDVAGPGAPALPVVVPVNALDGSRRVGRLAAWVHPGVWIAEALRDEVRAAKDDARIELSLIGPDGRALGVSRALLGPAAPAPDSELARGGFGLRAEAALEHAEPRYAVVARPVGDTGWTVRVARDTEPALASLDAMRSRFAAIGAALSVVAALLFWFPLRFVARPLARLRIAARKVESGEFDARVPVETNDEIGELAASFNRMADAVAQRTTALEAAAEDARRQRERLAVVISSMRDGLVVLDGEGRPLISNVAAGPILRALREGRSPVPHHACTGRANSLGCAACLADAAATATSCVVDIDGGVFEIRTARMAADDLGRPGRVLVARDVTDRVAEDERQMHQERLAVLGEVAAVMAHELNNPLAAINMFNGMLEDELPKESALREHTGVIRRSADSCKRSIRALLDYATGAAPEIERLDVHAVIEDVVRFLRPMRERARVALELDLGAKNPEIVGDETQLRQIFVNLVVNAVQAHRGAAGTVRIATRDAEDAVEADVSDTGPGVPPEIRTQIFRPFFTTKPRGEGTGLGLPTARRIAELHGGSLELVDGAGPGATFRVRLARSRRTP
jgi:signal transduction histidine kinase